jgi:hypothetical protein
MSKYTPGPWELRNEFGMQGLIYPRQAANPVASVTGYYTLTRQTEANARLIAAAPELLEALELLVSTYFDTSGAHGLNEREIVDKAYAAIAKAKGGQQ